MRIKMLVKAMVTGFGQEAVGRSEVIELADAAEAKALIAVNYAKETKEAITRDAVGPVAVTPISTGNVVADDAGGKGGKGGKKGEG